MTNAHTWSFLDRSKWSSGPWDDEPQDKVIWKHAGLTCMAHRIYHCGAWCGYVGLPPSHPLHGMDYDSLPELDAHGGINYSNTCQPHDKDTGRGICHTPEPGEPDDVWWLGFDCARCGDVATDYASLLPYAGATYKSLQFVRNETERLADQLAALVTA